MTKCEKLRFLHLRSSCTSSINPQDIKFKIVTLLQTQNGKCKRSRVVIWLTLTSISKGFSLSDTNISGRPGVGHPSAFFERALW